MQQLAARNEQLALSVLHDLASISLVLQLAASR